MTRITTDQFSDWLHANGKKPSTVRLYVDTVRALLNHLDLHGWSANSMRSKLAMRRDQHVVRTAWRAYERACGGDLPNLLPNRDAKSVPAQGMRTEAAIWALAAGSNPHLTAGHIAVIRWGQVAFLHNGSVRFPALPTSLNRTPPDASHSDALPWIVLWRYAASRADDAPVVPMPVADIRSILDRGQRDLLWVLMPEPEDWTCGYPRVQAPPQFVRPEAPTAPPPPAAYDPWKAPLPPIVGASPPPRPGVPQVPAFPPKPLKPPGT